VLLLVSLAVGFAFALWRYGDTMWRVVTITAIALYLVLGLLLFVYLVRWLLEQLDLTFDHW
jgi:hypothetical protein